jgi:hypothetical protein
MGIQATYLGMPLQLDDLDVENLAFFKHASQFVLRPSVPDSQRYRLAHRPHGDDTFRWRGFLDVLTCPDSSDHG